MPKNDLKQLALLGAQARIKELQSEAEEILRMFPQLKTGSGPVGRSPFPPGAGTRGLGRPLRSKRQFSAEGKKAISEGMRKYWARRKAKAAKKSAGRQQASD